MRENAFAISIRQSDVWYAAKCAASTAISRTTLCLPPQNEQNVTYLVTNDEQLIKHRPCHCAHPATCLLYLRAKNGTAALQGGPCFPWSAAKALLDQHTTT